MAKPNLIGGAVYFKKDGTQYPSRGAFTVNFGFPTRTTVFDGSQPIGYVEAPQEPFVEGDFTIPANFDVAEFVQADDQTITLEPDNGVVYVLRNAWFSGEGTIDLNEGVLSGGRFVGKSLEQLR